MYDVSKIGKRIATGGDRKVYMYGVNEVIKFSTLHVLLGKRLREKLVRDYAISKKYFADFVVETKDVNDKDKIQSIEVQPYIQGRSFTAIDVKEVTLRLQLETIVNGIQKMTVDGYAPLDLIGNAGVLNGTLSNVLVDEQNKLKIVDSTLLESSSLGIIGWLFIPIFSTVLPLRQQNLIKKLLKE